MSSTAAIRMLPQGGTWPRSWSHPSKTIAKPACPDIANAKEQNSAASALQHTCLQHAQTCTNTPLVRHCAQKHGQAHGPSTKTHTRARAPTCDARTPAQACLLARERACVLRCTGARTPDKRATLPAYTAHVDLRIPWQEQFELPKTRT